MAPTPLVASASEHFPNTQRKHGAPLESLQPPGIRENVIRADTRPVGAKLRLIASTATAFPTQRPSRRGAEAVNGHHRNRSRPRTNHRIPPLAQEAYQPYKRAAVTSTKASTLPSPSSRKRPRSPRAPPPSQYRSNSPRAESRSEQWPAGSEPAWAGTTKEAPCETESFLMPKSCRLVPRHRWTGSSTNCLSF